MELPESVRLVDLEPTFLVLPMGDQMIGCLACTDWKGRMRAIPKRDYFNRVTLDSCVVNWVPTKEPIIIKTEHEISRTAYGYAVARIDYWVASKYPTLRIRVYNRKQDAIEVFMADSGETYDGP